MPSIATACDIQIQIYESISKNVLSLSFFNIKNAHSSPAGIYKKDAVETEKLDKVKRGEEW